MKVELYIGLAKPIASKTWLPFGNVIGKTPESCIRKMMDSFADYTAFSSNVYSKEHEWEFAAARVCIVEDSIRRGREWEKLEAKKDN